MSKAGEMIVTMWLAGIPLNEILEKIPSTTHQILIKKMYSRLDRASLITSGLDFRRLLKGV